jgi:long-chain fatty acid transport protein
MTPFPRYWKPVAVAVALMGAAGVHATNGYFSHGYGIKAKGMGGASVALAQDGFAGANNPAAAAFAGNRYDVGIDLFMPDRSANNGGGPMVNSGRDRFLIPEFGYNLALSDRIGLGLTVYGNGGMNTTYNAAGTNLLGGTGKLGVDLTQLIVAPTLAYKVTPDHAIGVSPLLVYQRFEAYGLQGFGITPNPGDDSSTGVGVRLGYQGRLSDAISVGASYAPKINMSRFKKYANLFAGAGDFDIPENYTLGMAIKVSPTVTVAADYQRIAYNKVPSVANASLANFANGLGNPNGPGFGWTAVSVVKLGVQWQVNDQWQLRAGYNKGDNPVRSADAMFNILAPGVVENHFTLGGTYTLDKNQELSFAYMHAQSNTVTGPNSGGGNGTATVSMKQNSLGVQYSRKF